MLQSCQPNLRKYQAVQYTTATYIIQGFQNESKETVYLIYYLTSIYSNWYSNPSWIFSTVLHLFQGHSSSKNRTSFILTSFFKEVQYLLISLLNATFSSGFHLTEPQTILYCNREDSICQMRFPSSAKVIF